MAVIKFMLANLRKRKSYSIVIGILIFLTGLILSVTVSTAQKANEAYDTAFNNMEGPHLIYYIPENDYKAEYKTWFENRPEVESVKIRQLKFYNGGVFKKIGNILKDGTDNHLFVYNPDDKMRLIDAANPSANLSRGEIYMPYVYKTKYGVETNDTVDYQFGSNIMSFKVAGFIEDPISGADMMGSKFFYISSEDSRRISSLCKSNLDNTIQQNIRLKNFSESSVYKLEKEFNKNFESLNGGVSTYMDNKSGHLTLPRMAVTVLIAFAIILSIITITILRYAILATIESDYTNIGILKSLGFTPSMVQVAITGQYISIAIFSGFLSLLAGVFVTPVIGKIIMESSGLFFNGHLSLIAGTLTLLAIVFIIAVFTFITARRTNKITPIQAIANGSSPVYFASRLSVKLEKLKFIPFDLRMAVKQFMTKSKRYILLITISTLLAYALVFFLGLLNMFNSEKAISMVGGQLYDIELDTDTKADAEKILTQMKKDYGIEFTVYRTSEQLIIDDEKTSVQVSDDFDSSGQMVTLEGKHPKHDNEIALSASLKAKFGKGKGEYLSIRDSKGNQHQFLITGIFQTIDNDGKYARIHESGMNALFPGYKLNEAYITLKSHDNLDKTISEMQQRYTGYDEISNERVQSEDKLITIKSIFSGISTLIFVLTVILIGFIILLIMKITVYNETKEFGIYKAIGFSSLRLRLQLTLRFVLVTFTGSIAGAILELLSGSQLFSLLLKGVGLARFKIDFNLLSIIVPILFITVISMLSAFVTSRNTRKVSAYALINE